MPPVINWSLLGHWANWVLILEVMLVLMIVGTFIRVSYVTPNNS